MAARNAIGGEIRINAQTLNEKAITIPTSALARISDKAIVKLNSNESRRTQLQ